MLNISQSSRGFTLIELLVVIAIIGILTSVVLATFSTARNKGFDAAIQSSISNFRSSAENFGAKTDGTVDYLGTCAAAATLTADVDTKNTAGNIYCADDLGYWVFAVQLVATPGDYLCIDNTGTSTQYTGTIGGTPSGTACPITP